MRINEKNEMQNPDTRVDGLSKIDQQSELPRRTTGPSAHTPGPWTVEVGPGCNAEARDGVYASILSADDWYVADIWGDIDESSGQSIDIAKANARLIAAAPDLLVALIKARAMLQLGISHAEQRGPVFGVNVELATSLCESLLTEVRDAIAKATGQ